MSGVYDIPEGIRIDAADDVLRTGSHMLIVVGPSGTGKSTLLSHLMSVRGTCGLSRSTTTRAPRGNERDGVEYDFVSVSEFERRAAAGEFAEYANVFGNYYGTPHEMIRRNIDAGLDVLFDIDVQGARNLKKAYPAAWCVLIAPPSFDILEARLRARATDAEDVICRRLATAREELAQRGLFDFVIYNDDLSASCARLVSIYDVLNMRAAHM